MPTWLTAILVAVATTIATQYAILPRLEARKRRILVAHEARDRFQQDLLTILGAVARLGLTEVPAATPSMIRAVFAQERQRWVQQIDEATRSLVDSVEQYALGYARRGGLQYLAARSAMVVRAVWISDRPMDRRIQLVAQIAEPARRVFFAYWWHRLAHQKTDVHELCSVLDELAEPQEIPSRWLNWVRGRGRRARERAQRRRQGGSR